MNMDIKAAEISSFSFGDDRNCKEALRISSEHLCYNDVEIRLEEFV